MSNKTEKVNDIMQNKIEWYAAHVQSIGLNCYKFNIELGSKGTLNATDKFGQYQLCNKEKRFCIGYE